MHVFSQGARPYPPLLSANKALFLDFDGTLVDIQLHPHLVHATPELRMILRDVHRELNGAVCIVSGRSITDLDHFLEPLALPTSGQHGLERRTASGDVIRADIPQEPFAHMRQRLENAVQAMPGVFVEIKSMALAVHYRNAPDQEADVTALVQATVAPYQGIFHVQHGKMVQEIKPAGYSKGTSVRDFMQEPPFQGRIPVFIGDDITDEDGFAVMNETGGLSIQVGERLSSSARYGLENPQVVQVWLERFLADGEGT